MNITITDKDKFLYKIAQHLIIQNNLLKKDDLGLYNGKMGLILFFVHYAQYTSNKLYDDYAEELLGDIYNDIDINIDVNFGNGLCGIGWGIEYLLKNNFMEYGTIDMLTEIDKKILIYAPERILDQSLETGLEGIWQYVQSRLKSLHYSNAKELFDSKYMSDWNKTKSQFIEKSLTDILNQITQYPTNENILNWKLGLKAGCAGIGLKMILQ